MHYVWMARQIGSIGTLRNNRSGTRIRTYDARRGVVSLPQIYLQRKPLGSGNGNTVFSPRWQISVVGHRFFGTSFFTFFQERASARPRLQWIVLLLMCSDDWCQLVDTGELHRLPDIPSAEGLPDIIELVSVFEGQVG